MGQHSLLVDDAYWTMIRLRHNPVATVDPDENDDATVGPDGGYGVGSLWKNTVSGDLFICADPTIGAAIWRRITANAWFVQADAPSDPFVGDLWLDSDDGIVRAWSGSAWTSVADLTGPAGADGNMWYDGAGTPSSGLGADDDYYLESS